MIGVSIYFNDREPVYVNILAVPDVGEHVTWDGVPYLVIERCWYGTPFTWTAAIRLRRIP